VRRSLDVASGANGGAVKLLDDPGRARNIQVTVINPTNVTHAAFFGQSRRDLDTVGPAGSIAGIAVANVGNAVADITINGIAYQTSVLQGWTGELWAVSDTPNLILEYVEGAGPEK
jgi:hypothetical protein